LRSRDSLFRPLPDSIPEWLVFSGLFSGALLLWGVNLGGVPLRDWDEGTYGIVARELQASGQWIYLTLHGEPFLYKPPLLTWLIALGYQLGGINEWTTRLLPAFLSALSVPLLYGIGRSLFEQPRIALHAALVYLTLLPVVRHGRLAMHDGITVSAFLLLLLCCLKARQDRRWALGIGIALGLIGLSKGILMLLLGAIAGLFMVVEGEWAVLLHPYTGLGLVSGGMPLVGWYLAQGQKYGAQFWQVHFLSQSFNRLWESVEGNQGPVWYYLLEILKYGWPWLLFWPLGMGLLWQCRHQSWAKLVAIGTVLFLGVISGMGTKLPWYVMPIYPFMALAIAPVVASLWQPHHRARSLHWVGLMLLAIACLAAGIGAGLIERKPTLILLGITLGVTLGGSSWQLWDCNRHFVVTLFSGLYLALGILMVSPLWLWELNEAFPVIPVASLIRQQTAEEALIYTSFAYNRPSLDFYSHRWVRPIGQQEMATLWQPGVYFLLDSAAFNQMQLSHAQVLGTAEDFILVRHQSG
jgi:4-amino-4-deoxy-L-arabinose transferase-like glycosyltransferase